MKKKKIMKKLLVLVALSFGLVFTGCETLEEEKKSPCELRNYGNVVVFNKTPYQIQTYLEYGNRRTSPVRVSSGNSARFTTVPGGKVSVVARFDEYGYEYTRLTSFYLEACDDVEYTIRMKNSSAYESRGSIIGNYNFKE